MLPQDDSSAGCGPGAINSRHTVKRILIIDDEEWLREVVKIGLVGKGYEVLEAENGAVGIEMARKHLPDLILCDIRMEKVDGFLTLAELRDFPETTSIPFIFITGQADVSGMRHGMDLGADDYLLKPFTIDSLLAAVDARLKKVQSMRDDAERTLRHLRENISFMLPHELRTPLTGIIGCGELLAENVAGLSAQEIAEMGREITESGKRLESLIDKFLTYVQLELVAADPSRVVALRQQQTNDSSLVIAERAHRQAERVGRSNDLTLTLETIPLGINSDHLGMLVDELVQNAFKFSQAGSPVVVELRAENGGGVLSVGDRGCGLTPEQIKRIGAYMQFERKQREQQGFGLGLVLVRRVADLHGGRLAIESAPDSGTRCSVSLPPPHLETPRY